MNYLDSLDEGMYPNFLGGRISNRVYDQGLLQTGILQTSLNIETKTSRAVRRFHINLAPNEN